MKHSLRTLSLFLLAAATLLGVACVPDQPAPDEKKEEKREDQPPAKRVELSKNIFLEIQGKQRRVVVNAVVCLREGQLELLMTRRDTKEHEAVLSADLDARDLHKALLLAETRAGEPVKFDPKYTPASGQTIKITVTWVAKGETITIPAQEFIRHSTNKKVMAFTWVFAGSRLVKNPLDGNKLIFLANDGDLVCVSNFESALLDVPVKSTKDTNDLIFEANTDKIPPMGTKVTVTFEPMPDPKK